jgi:hypothetical protein
MLSETRMFFGGLGTSFASVAIVLALGPTASHESRARQSTPDPYFQLQPIAPASAETTVPSAAVEASLELQSAMPASAETPVASAPEPGMEVQAETPVEMEKRPGIESRKKKTHLKRERLEKRADRRTKLVTHRVRHAQKLRVSKLLDER